MPRNLFEHEMSDLKGSLVDLGHLIDTIIADTLQMLRQPNPETAAAVARREETVNTMERRIEDSCVNIIALQQPLARDLRTITAALKIVTDMERISDQCCDTCEILRALAPLSEGARPPVHLGEMLERTRSMFDDALSAFVSHDIALSYEVCDRDDEVDALFSRTILEICAAIEGQPVVVPRGADYMFIAKYIERIADHATNIAEWTIFIETGEHPDLNQGATPTEK